MKNSKSKKLADKNVKAAYGHKKNLNRKAEALANKNWDSKIEKHVKTPGVEPTSEEKLMKKAKTKLGKQIIEGLEQALKAEESENQKNNPNKFVEENWEWLKESHKIKDLQAKAKRAMSRKRHLRKLNHQKEAELREFKTRQFFQQKYRDLYLEEVKIRGDLTKKVEVLEEKLKKKRAWWEF